MIAAGMPIIMLSMTNARKRKSQWFISNCELLPVDIFYPTRYFIRLIIIIFYRSSGDYSLLRLVGNDYEDKTSFGMLRLINGT